MEIKSQEEESCRSKKLETTETPPWIDLPRDIISNILKRLGTVEILESTQMVCKTWRIVCTEDPSMWRVIRMRNYTKLVENYDKYEIMCRHAVDRSQGQLVEINIRYFGTARLLQYISDRCNGLKHITIGNCKDVSIEDVRVAVEKFPQLDTLILVKMPDIFKNGNMKFIRDSCPMLTCCLHSNQT